MSEETQTYCMQQINLAINLHRARLIKKDTTTLFNFSRGPQAGIRLQASKALEFVWIDSWFENGQINTEAIKHIQKLNPPLPVVLLIGTKSSCISQFAEALVHQMVPFETSDYFAASTYTQILPIPYVHPLIKGEIGQAIVICLRMDSDKPKLSQTMVTIAKALIPAASIACLLADDLQLHPQDLFGSQLANTKVVLIHSRECEVNSWKFALRGGDIMHEVMEVLELRGRNIETAVRTIHGELDHWPITSTSLLTEQINSLTAILEEFHV